MNNNNGRGSTPRPTPKPAQGSSCGPEVIRRLARIEARLVQTMKHMGMQTDGRAPLPADEQHQPIKEN